MSAFGPRSTPALPCPPLKGHPTICGQHELHAVHSGLTATVAGLARNLWSYVGPALLSGVPWTVNRPGEVPWVVEVEREGRTKECLGRVVAALRVEIGRASPRHLNACLNMTDH